MKSANTQARLAVGDAAAHEPQVDAVLATAADDETVERHSA